MSDRYPGGLIRKTPPTVTPGSPVGGVASAFFAGNEEINIDAALINDGLSSWELQCWVYWNTTGTSTDMGMVVSQYASGLSGRMIFGSQSGALVYRLDGATVYLTAPVAPFTWYHVCLNYDGTTHRLFINGLLADSATGVPAVNTATNTSIGGQPTLSNYAIDGYINSLTITQNVTVNTSNFVPTAVTLGTSGLVLLTCQGSDVTADATGTNTTSNNGVVSSDFLPTNSDLIFPAVQGSAPGIWTMDQVAYYIKEGTWPKVLSGSALPRELYGWGDNGDGVLGINVDQTSDRSSPVQVGALTTWDQVSSGNDHSVAVKTDGTLWTWGYNDYGSLGDGTVISRSSPVQIGSLTTWSQAVSANEFTIAVKTDGTLWSWGNNNQGRLGLNDDVPRSSPTQIGSDTNWYKISAGYSATHTVAIKTDGTLWTWGNNLFGQLGQNDTVSLSSPVQIGALTNWAEISAGGQNSGAVKTDGTLWMWGRSDDGRLGDNAITRRSSPVQIGALTDWKKLTVNSTCHAIKTTGTLWGWGYNANGQIGDNTTIARSSPVQIGSLTTWAETTWAGGAIKTDGTLWTWGLNIRGELGENTQGALTYRSSPVQIGSETNWSKITQGEYMFMATTKG